MALAEQKSQRFFPWGVRRGIAVEIAQIGQRAENTYFGKSRGLRDCRVPPSCVRLRLILLYL